MSSAYHPIATAKRTFRSSRAGERPLFAEPSLWNAPGSASRCAATVMAITKCPIWVQTVSGLTVAPRVLRQCGITSDWMVGAGLMERKNMDRTSDELRALDDAATRVLIDSELDTVVGGQKNVTTILWSPVKIRTGLNGERS